MPRPKSSATPTTTSAKSQTPANPKPPALEQSPRSDSHPPAASPQPVTPNPPMTSKTRKVQHLRQKLQAHPTLLTQRVRGGGILLHWAAYKGNEEAIIALLAEGADPVARTDDGHIPLLFAVTQGHKACAGLLVEALMNARQATLASQSTSTTTVLPRIVSTSTQTESPQARQIEAALGDTLVSCVRNDDLVAIQDLNALGVDLDSRDSQVSTALHWAVREHAPEILDFLIEWSADRNLPDADGDRPLHLALHNGDQATFASLIEDFNGLEAGADPWALNRSSQTAYDVASEESQYEVMGWLERWMKHDPRWREMLRRQGRQSELDALE